MTHLIVKNSVLKNIDKDCLDAYHSLLIIIVFIIIKNLKVNLIVIVH